MTLRTKQTYLKACAEQSAEWLRDCVRNPSPYMQPIHVALVRIALRRKAKAA